MLTAFIPLVLSLFCLAKAEPLGKHAHDLVARRHSLRAIHHNSSAEISDELQRRGGSRMTYYEAGLGACGWHNTGSDYIVAISAQHWDGGSHCGKTIKISYQGKTARAQVADECMECPYDAIDLTHDLFAFFASPPEVVGTIYGDWSFVDGGDSGDGKEDDPKPSTTTTKKPRPTTTTTSTKSSTSTTKHSKTSSTSSSATTTSSSASTTTTTSSVAPTPTSVIQVEQGNLDKFSLAMLQLAAVLVTGAAGKQPSL